MKYFLGVLVIIVIIAIMWMLLIPNSIDKVSNRINETFGKVIIRNEQVDKKQYERDSLKTVIINLNGHVEKRNKVIDSLSHQLEYSQSVIDSITNQMNVIDKDNYSDADIKKFFSTWKK